MLQTTFDASQASDSLYAWWMSAVPAFFEAASARKPDVAAGIAHTDASDSTAALGPLPNALDMARQLLTPLYEASLQALLAQPQPGIAIGEVLEQARTRLNSFVGTLANSRQLLPAQSWMPWLGTNPWPDPTSAIGDAVRPLILNLERAYGGLADAFGLAPSRELQQAMRELMAGAVVRQQAQAEYLAIVATALAKGIDGTLARLREMGQRGESVDSLLALTRVWARSTDEAVHAAMQAPDALDASARLLRASTDARRQLQRAVGVMSATLNVPTRAEMDDAYREIQELKREVRRLRKASPQVGAAAVELVAVPAGNGRATRRRAAPAKTTRPRKATA